MAPTSPVSNALLVFSNDIPPSGSSINAAKSFPNASNLVATPSANAIKALPIPLSTATNKLPNLVISLVKYCLQ